MERGQLIRVFVETTEDIKNGYYVNQNEEEISFEKVKALKNGTKFFKSTEMIPVNQRPNYASTKIYVENIDTFKKAIQFGPNGACLNMASSFNPGGGVANGSRAQEEELCRRSNLILSLRAFSRYSEFKFSRDPKEGCYPIPISGGIYSPCVNIYKDTNYQEMEDPILTNVISVPAVNKPTLNEDGTITKNYVAVTKNKIRTILRIAILGQHSKLVLGALGCGAYGNPAAHMAEIFKDVLNEEEFVHSFEEICFAVLDDHNAKRLDNREGNYKPFARVFGENKA